VSGSELGWREREEKQSFHINAVSLSLFSCLARARAHARREATTPNRSIVLLKFRDTLQASDFLVIFTGRAFSTLDARETCHPIRIHHLVLHKTDTGVGADTGASSHVSSASLSRSRSACTSVNAGTSGTVSIPAFPPSVYASRAAALPELLHGVPPNSRYELPSCPVCLERLDSTVTGLVTLPCAHTFDCDCLRKWGDSRCPVCRVSHLLLSTTAGQVPNAQSKGQLQAQAQAQGQGQGASALGQAGAREGRDGREEILRLTQCSMCDSTENNWICVVCGVVGCGRYEPGKGHARRHWEESGHVLAMELETQRVWDYKGDK
jgi:BRCA1-associated protein